MRSFAGKVARTALPLSVLLTCQKIFANSGIQIPLSQFQAGTEKATLVTNGGFEQHGAFDANGRTTSADGWTQFGGMYASNQPFNPPSNSSVIGTTVAQAVANQGTPDLFSRSLNIGSLPAAHSYVLSAYIWNQGRPTQGTNLGDLAEVKLVDTTDTVNNNLSIEIEPSGLDGGSGATGYFVYDTISAADLAKFDPNNTEFDVQGEDETTVTGTRPDVWAQWDNIGFTPAENFVGHKWISATGANWGDGSRWNSQGAVGPSTKGAIVTFSDAASSDESITVESGKVVGVINFNNPTAHYTLAGPGQITFDLSVHGVNNSPSGVAEINVLSGSHTISANIGLARDAVFNVINPASVLTISGTVTSQTMGSGTASYSGQNLAKDGPGMLQMKSLQIPNISILAGKVQMIPNGGPANVSRIKSLTISGATDAWTSQLDLSNDDMIIDYSGGSTSFGTIANQLKSGFAGGGWNGNGIISSRAAAISAHKTGIGYLDTALFNPGSFDGVTTNGTMVLLKYTLRGDANLDGVVNALDFNAVATNFGQNAGGQFWPQGDFNYDGNVNTLDFTTLAANFGAPLAGSALGAAVPEPCMILLPLCLPLLGRLRRTAKSLVAGL
jgi:hypothetical protein